MIFLFSHWIIHCENERIWPCLPPCATTSPPTQISCVFSLELHFKNILFKLLGLYSLLNLIIIHLNSNLSLLIDLIIIVIVNDTQTQY